MQNVGRLDSLARAAVTGSWAGAGNGSRGRNRCARCDLVGRGEMARVGWLVSRAPRARPARLGRLAQLGLCGYGWTKRVPQGPPASRDPRGIVGPAASAARRGSRASSGTMGARIRTGRHRGTFLRRAGATGADLEHWGRWGEPQPQARQGLRARWD